MAPPALVRTVKNVKIAKTSTSNRRRDTQTFHANLSLSGKTLLARAVAHHTECTFIRVSGSELVQKFIGKMAQLKF